VDVSLIIRQRLEDLGLEQRDLAAAAQVTESYISQLLSRKKRPHRPSSAQISTNGWTPFWNFRKGTSPRWRQAQRHDALKRKLAEPPSPLFREVRELIIRKCNLGRRTQVREIFEQQGFGELERLVTQTLLDVAKRVAREELNSEKWLRGLGKLRHQSYERSRR